MTECMSYLCNFLTFHVLIVGLKSRSTQHFLWLLALLVLLVFICAVVSLVVSLRTERRITKQLLTAATLPVPHALEVPRNRRIPKYSWLGAAFIACSLISYRVGYVKAEADFKRDRYSYSDVLVEERYDGQNFLVHPARMTPFNMTTCEQTDWKQGEKMKFLHFKWSPNCDFVGSLGDFEFYSEHGKRIIFHEQMASAQ